VFEGVFTALVTPFRDGALDERALHDAIEQQIAAGVDGLVPCGSTGEAATLSHAEHRRVVEVTVAAARGRVQVLAGTGSNSTSEAIELTRHAKEAGADGALLISPYYNRPTQDGIVAHYAEVARQTAFPLVAYNVPGRTASNVLPATLARLAEVDQIVGVKESCGDLNQIAHVLSAVPRSFSVLSGDDWATLPLLALGAKGVISTASNVAPGEIVDMVRAFRAGDLERARALHYRLLPLLDVLFCETNPIPVKAAVAMRAGVAEELRLPLTRISEANRGRLEAVLKELGLL
jgi:4-hydroxy-tetrahydrodipicolinate synthase